MPLTIQIMFCFTLIAVFIVATNATPIPNVLSSRIYDGQEASIKDFPYQVSIEFIEHQDCGGSIIAKNWIVTAGHCSSPGYEVLLKIRAGSDLREKGGSIHHVDKVIRHENYGEKLNGVPVNDIALMRVKEPFDFDETRQPIELVAPGTKAVPGKMANVSGYGWVRESEFPRHLQWVQVPFVDYERCNQAYNEYGGVPEGYICAAYFGEQGRNACKGDSGGPLTTDGKLAGIVSWSYNCAQPKYPTVYTDVAFYRDWIDRQIQF